MEYVLITAVVMGILAGVILKVTEASRRRAALTQVLDKRLANGEITPEEYQKLKQDIKETIK